MGCNITITTNLLVHWIDSHACKHSLPPFNIIQDKALLLISDLKRKGNPTSADFNLKASQRWYGRYKKCANLHSIKLGDEKVSTNLYVASPFQVREKRGR
jgi:hypothetical protein